MQFSFLGLNLELFIMESLREQFRAGEVYRRSDLEYYSTAIDRHLGILVDEGTLVKLSHGLYYAPRTSKFGMVPPDEWVLIERFLKGSDFLILKPTAYNTLGLGLTQVYNTTWVYNHKRKGEYTFFGNSFEFKIKPSFPGLLTREFLLVDLLNNLHDLAEDPNRILTKLHENFNSFSKDELMKAAQQFGSGSTRKMMKAFFRTKRTDA